MKRMFLPQKGRINKGEYALLVRRCGFGVPDVERALWSASDSLTMIVEESLHPFQRSGSSEPTYRDMHFHALPWPLEELESLGEQQVEMGVTLSYFVEPNPSRRSVRSRYRYASHGLRFDVRRPAESEQDFRARLNRLASDAEGGSGDAPLDAHWYLGTENRARGSIHSDIWCGSAAELASRGLIGVYPTTGWWKTRHRLGRYDSAARYALIVSIHAPEVEIDLYEAVENRIAAATQIVI
jgi:hypothetical protein